MLQKSQIDYTVEDLKAPDFLLLDKIDQKDLLPFIVQSFKQRNKVFYFFNSINILFAIILVTLMCKEFFHGEFRFSTEFEYFSYGVLITFLLIPLHEYIHVLAYRYVGAKNTSYGMNLRKFYFMALADKFVANARQFRVVILAPFISISIVCLSLAILLPGYWRFIPIGLFFTHTLFCSGDFGLLSYLENHKDKDIYTYDDVEQSESYFFEKVSEK